MRPCPKPVKRPKAPRRALKRSRMRKALPKRLSRPGSLPGYRTWLRAQPCVYADATCWGAVEVSHLRDHTGLGLKAPDYDAIPKCRGHHAAWEERRAPFTWSQETRVVWFKARAIEHAARYFLETGVNVLPEIG